MSETLLWINREEGTVTGPHGIAFLRRELDSGSITLDTLATQDGTQDWMPLETWGGELYPPEVSCRGPRATKVYVDQMLEDESKKLPVPLALTLILGIAGAVYFTAFYDIGVNTPWGSVANQGRMNTRIVGTIACLGTTAIFVLVHMNRKKR